MIICKKCGAGVKYTGSPCPKCNEIFTFDEVDIENARAILEDALNNKQYEEVLECYHILADAGECDAERAYAKIYEKGSLAPRNFAIATEYYGRAARKNDPYSAYRYSRLIMRDNDETGRFWLLFSAVLGASEAYAEAAEEFSAIGCEDDANYFYALAAACDDVDSIVAMAKRYYSGIGTVQSPKHAKWYMDKLTIPPIYAIKLAYKLRGITAEEPPMPMLKSYDGLLRRLKEQAQICGFDTAHFKLSEILAQRGDTDAAVTVGVALARGNGTRQDLKEGLRILSGAAAHGSIDAHLAIGRLYTDAETIEPNTDMALEHYLSAGKLGSAVGYMLCGDIYISLDGDGGNIARAVHFYDLAADLGSAPAREKSDIIKLERNRYFKNAFMQEKTNPEEALKLYSLSCSMGHSRATLKLADCFKYAIGTKENRGAAFKWYKAAAELGEDEALLPLGVCYAEGYGTALDFDKAREVLTRAEKTGDERAHALIMSLLESKLKTVAGRLYSTAMRLIHMQKFDAAKRYLEISAELNNPKALYTLGCFYEFGICAPCDKRQAYSHYEKAYSLSFRDPRSRYKLVILKMIKSQRGL